MLWYTKLLLTYTPSHCLMSSYYMYRPLLFKPRTDREFGDFCRDSAAVFSHFCSEKFAALVISPTVWPQFIYLSNQQPTSHVIAMWLTVMRRRSSDGASYRINWGDMTTIWHYTLYIEFSAATRYSRSCSTPKSTTNRRPRPCWSRLTRQRCTSLSRPFCRRTPPIVRQACVRQLDALPHVISSIITSHHITWRRRKQASRREK